MEFRLVGSKLKYMKYLAKKSFRWFLGVEKENRIEFCFLIHFFIHNLNVFLVM